MYGGHVSRPAVADGAESGAPEATVCSAACIISRLLYVNKESVALMVQSIHEQKTAVEQAEASRMAF